MEVSEQSSCHFLLNISLHIKILSPINTRKKDFASQYFTMGMMENNPGKMANGTDVKPEDNVKWPLVLNIPGEGFGDDMLQRYSNHELLTDEDDDLFMLIENYEEIGGACVNIGGGEGAG